MKNLDVSAKFGPNPDPFAQKSLAPEIWTKVGILEWTRGSGIKVDKYESMQVYKQT